MNLVKIKDTQSIPKLILKNNGITVKAKLELISPLYHLTLSSTALRVLSDGEVRLLSYCQGKDRTIKVLRVTSQTLQQAMRVVRYIKFDSLIYTPVDFTITLVTTHFTPL